MTSKYPADKSILLNCSVCSYPINKCHEDHVSKALQYALNKLPFLRILIQVIGMYFLYQTFFNCNKYWISKTNETDNNILPDANARDLFRWVEYGLLFVSNPYQSGFPMHIDFKL